jgi:hemerythrin-like metal-binding protein
MANFQGEDRMALLNWRRKRYSVGVPALDSQHAAYIRCLNKLHAAMIRGEGRSVTGPLLRNLILGARDHFSAEEELMTSTNYPGLVHHPAEHRAFAAKLEELIERHEQGETIVSIPLLRFMRDWLRACLRSPEQ